MASTFVRGFMTDQPETQYESDHKPQPWPEKSKESKKLDSLYRQLHEAEFNPGERAKIQAKIDYFVESKGICPF